MENFSKSTLYLLVSFLSFNILAAEKSPYQFKWLDDDETVYVLQNKEHIKAHNFGVDLSYATSDASPYQETSGLFLALTYYISENWSVDFTYKKYFNEDSTDLSNLVNAYKADDVKPIIRRINSAMLFHINWIPFYGKINTFNEILFFDWGLGFGVGQFETQGNYKTFLIKNKNITYVDETDTGFNLKSYVKFYTRSRVTMGFEYNLMGVDTIKDPQGKSDIHYYTDIMATVGYLF